MAKKVAAFFGICLVVLAVAIVHLPETTQANSETQANESNDNDEYATCLKTCLQNCESSEESSYSFCETKCDTDCLNKDLAGNTKYYC